MSESASRPRFIPPLCWYGGVALCVVITALLSFLYWPNPVNRPDGLILPTNRYYLLLVVVLIRLGALGANMVFASAFSLWVTVSFILAFNFLSKPRRLLFKKELIEWGKWYALITFLAIYSLLTPD